MSRIARVSPHDRLYDAALSLSKTYSLYICRLPFPRFRQEKFVSFNLQALKCVLDMPTLDHSQSQSLDLFVTTRFGLLQRK